METKALLNGKEYIVTKQYVRTVYAEDGNSWLYEFNQHPDDKLTKCKEVEESIEDWVLRKALVAMDDDKNKSCLSGDGSLKQEDIIQLTKRLKEGYTVEKKKRVVMVDMDGTLTHSAWRNGWAPSNGGTWPRYHEMCDKDMPTSIVKLVNELSKEYDIVISTARPEYARGKTVDWIVKNCQFMPEILMRMEDQEGMKSPELKKIHIDWVRNKGRKIALFIDDRKDVCDMAMEIGVIPLLVNPEKDDLEKQKEKSIKTPYDGSKDAGDALAFALKQQKEFINGDPDKEPTGFINMKTPDQILKESGEFFKERNDEYGDAWLRHGTIMQSNFPDGITLKTKIDFFLYHCLVMDVVKTTRICNAMANGKDHPDSWIDKMVYSAMAKSQIVED